MAAAATHRGFAESDLSVWDKARYHLFLLYALHSGNAPAAFIIMSSQKSHKQYIHVTSVPVGMQLSEAPLLKTLDQCLWFSTGECQKSGLREHITKEPYDGKACKCFAYVSQEYIK